MSDDFYRTFEDKYRGTRELIKSRLEVYLPFIRPLLELYPNGAIVDVGCGRGEWLELTSQHGFHPQGVDIDDGMLQNCRELGLNVTMEDALVFLKKLPDESQAVISGFHIVEHLPFNQLRQLVQEAKRTLTPGGLLILETPNPENLIVGTSSFYLDPTHHRPIPPELLHFITEYYGFYRKKIVRLQEPVNLIDNPATSLMDVMRGVSPDYSIIAQKNASPDILQMFDQPFNRAYGLTLQELSDRFQQSITTQMEPSESTTQTQLLHALQVAHQALLAQEKAQALSASLAQDRQKLEVTLAKVQQDLNDALQANHSYLSQLERTQKELHEVHQYNHHHWLLAEQRNQQLNELLNSRYWRITAPLRATNLFLRPVISRVLRSAVHKGKGLANRIPAFKRSALWVLRRSPMLERLVTRFSTKPFSAERAQQEQIRNFEQLRSVRIINALSQIVANDGDGPVIFLNVSSDVS